MSPTNLTERLKSQARQLGFGQVGVCPAVTPSGLSEFAIWLERGYAGEMHYLPDRREAYDHPRSVLAGVRSLVMLTLPYATEAPQRMGPGEGRIARYAWGSVDYHDFIHDRLKRLKQWMCEACPDGVHRGVVDTAPLFERQFAQFAGLGWQGKNTLLLNRHQGSFFFLAALLTDEELEPDDPFTDDHCGTCTACLDACPTDAFPQPYVLDARRCISYLTIEKRTQIELEWRDKLSGWLFGCDICQDVCPWNRHGDSTGAADFAPQDGHNPVELMQLFALDPQEFRKRFRHTALHRAKRPGILRNAALLLGGQRHRPAIPVLIAALEDPAPLVRGAVIWALGQFKEAAIHEALRRRQSVEHDPDVQLELSAVLSEGLGISRTGPE